MIASLPYREVWLVDFEFHQPAGEKPTVICMVAREFRTVRTIRAWADELAKMAGSPFPIGKDSLVVAYLASAECSCFLALGWPSPDRILDLYTEFRCLTNGRPTSAGNGLLGALAEFGLAAIAGAEKQEMRQLAQRGEPFTDAERVALLEYCETDVVALAGLLRAMLPHIDLPRSLLRGRYMSAVARMEWAGVPIDIERLHALRCNWDSLKRRLVQAVNEDYGVYVPTTGGRLSFSSKRFAAWLAQNGIPWPRLESGALALDDDTFRQMAKMYPTVAPLRELRHALGEMRLESLAVGSDHRNRCMLSPYRSITGRNQPSNARFIFGPSCWLRALIKPASSRALAYVDWSQQEFGIAAALSGDVPMQEAYLSGDPYLTFAKQAGAVPRDATKESHPREREQFKVCALAVQYGMGAKSLAQSLGRAEAMARELLRRHRATYPTFWRWSQAAVDYAMITGWLHTVFGWRVQVAGQANPRSLANFPMQANGAEMLRLACCLATERGIAVCAPVHDALLVEGPADSIQDTVQQTQEAMEEASRVILDGFTLRSDAKVFTWPDRYVDERGEQMWGTVMQLLTELEQQEDLELKTCC